jgi:hypothetical protein
VRSKGEFARFPRFLAALYYVRKLLMSDAEAAMEHIILERVCACQRLLYPAVVRHELAPPLLCQRQGNLKFALKGSLLLLPSLFSAGVRRGAEAQLPFLFEFARTLVNQLAL